MFAHFRPIFLGFLSLMLGIFFSELFREGKSIFFIVFLALVFAIIVFGLLNLAVKTNFFKFFGKYLKPCCVVLVCFAVGSLSFWLVVNALKGEEVPKVNTNETYYVIAKISSTPIVYENYTTLFAEDATISSESQSQKIEKHKIYVKITNESVEKDVLLSAKIGDFLLFYAKLKNVDVLGDDGIFSFAYKNDVRYFAYVTFGSISLTEGTMGTLDSIRTFVKDKIYASMNSRQAGLAYAVFVGDKSGLDQDIQENFRATGLAHLLAVSGLHVSIMMLVLMWILEKMRLKPKIALIVVILILLFYCILCGFCASVLRASLMTIFLLFGKAFDRQTDQLNSVSLAGVLLLLFNPMFVFDLSFLLSFASVFGIIFLYPIFFERFKKLKLGNFISASLAISISAQIATLPFLINSFGYVSVIALFANFVVGPIFEYTYIAFFVSLVINLVLPFMGFLLWLAQWGFWLVDVVSAWFASWSITTIALPALATTILFWFFGFLFCSSRFNVSPARTKVVVLSSLGAVGFALLCLNVAGLLL